MPFASQNFDDFDFQDTLDHVMQTTIMKSEKGEGRKKTVFCVIRLHLMSTSQNANFTFLS